jgi:hypothetical protein
MNTHVGVEALVGVENATLNELDSLGRLDDGGNKRGDCGMVGVIEVQRDLQQGIATHGQLDGVQLQDETVVADGISALLVEPVPKEGVDGRVGPTRVSLGRRVEDGEAR